MSQSPKPSLHVAVHVPPLHVVPGHALPQAPQFATLRVTSTQRPAQHASPAAQLHPPSPSGPLSCTRTMLSSGSSTSISTIVPLSVTSMGGDWSALCPSALTLVSMLALSRAFASSRGSYTAQPPSSAALTRQAANREKAILVGDGTIKRSRRFP